MLVYRLNDFEMGYENLKIKKPSSNTQNKA